MTPIGLKSYNKNAAKMDCRDIINKLNEVSLECPTVVAKSVVKHPLAASDAFNLAKISKDITNILRIDEHVTTSFYALSCLQKDFRYVMDKCEPVTRSFLNRYFSCVFLFYIHSISELHPLIVMM